MFLNIYPVFEKKRLLKKEMLENIRDYPRNLFGLLYQGYSDGVLAGCDLESDEGGVVVRPGILYYKGLPYFLEEPWRVPCEPEGKLVYLKVRFLDKSVGIGQVEYLTKIYLDGNGPDAGQEIELGRFKLQEGARLRTDYVDYYDYSTEFDTVNRIHVPYAAPGGNHGIWPQLLRCYAKALMGYSPGNALDCAFCMNCLQLWEAVPYEMVRVYLNSRLGREGEYTNEEIYLGLKRILSQAGGRGEGLREAEKKERTLLMI
ncbi:MAG: hypothetical protein NC307_10815 [Roseburia sp.]|nr:hypothetical protein [Roseburia sp.]